MFLSKAYLHLHSIVSITDRAGVIVDANDGFCKISGYSIEWRRGKWIQPGDLVELWIEGIGAMKLTAKRTPRELSYVRDGMNGHLEVPESARDYPQKLKDGTAPPARR